MRRPPGSALYWLRAALLVLRPNLVPLLMKTPRHACGDAVAEQRAHAQILSRRDRLLNRLRRHFNILGALPPRCAPSRQPSNVPVLFPENNTQVPGGPAECFVIAARLQVKEPHVGARPRPCRRRAS